MKEKDFRANILVVDDEEGICRLLKGILSSDGYAVKTLTSSKRVIPLLARESFDLIITDIRMPDFDGIDLLKEILLQFPDQPVLMITAYGSIENAVEAIRIGAYDYITKPFQKDEILHSAAKVLERQSLIRENSQLKTELGAIQGVTGGVVGKSRIILETIAFARKVADSNLSILLTGETGTGKEVFAKFIHQESGRRNNPFIPIQCGLIPVNLMESELFGHKKGSFTDATSDKMGLIEEAEKGTVFLDEIGDISTDIQSKLLRFLQEKEIRKVGDSKSRTIDVRFISATNKDLSALVRDKMFREDLFYRLKAVEIHLPSLRERKEDIPLLVEHFLAGFNMIHDRHVKMDGACFKFLLSHSWPGNIRELRNLVETSATICSQKIITIADISFILNRESREFQADVPYADLKKRLLRDFDISYLNQLLKKYKGNITAASREAGMDKKNLWEMMKKYSISAAAFKE
jgi:DNA-binding NtrC family response regulator